MTATENATDYRNRQVRDRACGSKRKYLCRKDADRARNSLQASEYFVEDRRPVSPYRCPFCRFWHIGHQPSMVHLRELAATIRNLPAE